PASPGQARRERRPAISKDVPGYARDVYASVLRNGRAPQCYVGGRVWQNREHRLPRGESYREFDVHPKVRGVNRGPERIIVDMRTRRGWYTADHYRTFIPMAVP
ncbi:MAG TPA: ribonuclease domain-containing protein, partial [Bacteroidota bacterium]|nr:ribonuclease domain-containing protein [Bacteroidota bacterium]